MVQRVTYVHLYYRDSIASIELTTVQKISSAIVNESVALMRHTGEQFKAGKFRQTKVATCIVD